MASRPLGASKSEGTLTVNSKLPANRRQQLLSLKQREDLKDVLTEKFRGRFGRGAKDQGPDEVSVATTAIRQEVEEFATKARASHTNLARLERRIQHKALQPKAATESASMVSAVSQYTGLSKQSAGSRSLVSNGAKIARQGGVNSNSEVSQVSETCDWAKLDEYASFLHEQDVHRMHLGTLELQRKLREDLDRQIAERKAKQQHHDDEDRRFHNSLMDELNRWRQMEKERGQEMKQKLQREKQDRDEQLEYERQLKEAARQRKQDEEGALVAKIVREMETEQRRYERRKRESRAAMQKVLRENEEDEQRRRQQKKDQQERDAFAMREYHRLMDEQERERAEAMAARLGRQKELMEKLTANVTRQAEDVGGQEAMRAARQQEEMERHRAEAEMVKQHRLKQLNLETQAYLVKQMTEKDGRKREEKELQNLQALIIEKDTEEYNDIQKAKTMNRRQNAFEHRRVIEGQIEHKSKIRPDQMTSAEVKMNKKLVKLAKTTLKAKQDLESEEASRRAESVEED